MNILPTLADVRKIASDGAYKVIPVSCEILAVSYTHLTLPTIA